MGTRALYIFIEDGKTSELYSRRGGGPNRIMAGRFLKMMAAKKIADEYDGRDTSFFHAFIRGNIDVKNPEERTRPFIDYIYYIEPKDEEVSLKIYDTNVDAEPNELIDEGDVELFISLYPEVLNVKT